MAISDSPDSRRDDLIAEIEVAFKSAQRGEGVTLHEAHQVDSYGSPERCRKARARDTETNWQDVPDSDIEEGCSVLNFLDAEGFRYYIPAYMIWTLQNYLTSQSLTVDFTIYTFSHGGPNDPRLRLLDRAQLNAIVSFLKYFAEQDDGMADSIAASEALRIHWAKYTDPRAGSS